MVATLKRMTTEFVEAEDRLRLSGEVENAAPVVMWLTHRLAARLLPALLQWLDRTTGVPLRREIIHSFAQEAALAALQPQAPVQAPPSGEAWRLDAIDITPAEDAIGLVLRAEDARADSLGLTAQELRQWPSIHLARRLAARRVADDGLAGMDTGRCQAIRAADCSSLKLSQWRGAAGRRPASAS